MSHGHYERYVSGLVSLHKLCFVGLPLGSHNELCVEGTLRMQLLRSKLFPSRFYDRAMKMTPFKRLLSLLVVLAFTPLRAVAKSIKGDYGRPKHGGSLRATSPKSRRLGNMGMGMMKKNKGADSDDAPEDDEPEDNDSRDIAPQCLGEERLLTSNVAVSFQNVPDTVDTDQFVVLEDTFMTAYNRLALCSGGSFQQVAEVSVVDRPSDRRDLIGGFGNRIRGFGRFHYRVRFKCNACPRDIPLLDNDAGRRRDLAFSFEQRKLQEGLPVCSACEIPTNQVFLASYNEVIQEVKETGELNFTFGPADTASELEPVACEGDIQIHETAITIESYGYPGEASEEELETLALGVWRTINGLTALNPSICDPFFRSIVSARAEVPTKSNQTEESPRGPPRAFPLIVFLEFECRGCSDNITLLELDDDAADSQRLLQQVSHVYGNHRSLQNAVQGKCLCAVGAEAYRGPTRTEFDAAFNQTVLSLMDDGLVEFVIQFGNTTEVEEIECSSNVVDRQTLVAIEAEGSLELTDKSNVAQLEIMFEESFATIASITCDPEDKTIDEVRLVGVEPAGPGRIVLLFKVDFQCRNCSNDSDLFHENQDRRLGAIVRSKERGASMRRLNDEVGKCYCDVNAVNSTNAVTLEEFMDTWRDTLEEIESLVPIRMTGANEIGGTPAPVTTAPQTMAPQTMAPQTMAPQTMAPITNAPITIAPVTFAPVTSQPATEGPVTTQPVTISPVTSTPVTDNPTLQPVTPITQLDIAFEVTVTDRDDDVKLMVDLAAGMDRLIAEVLTRPFSDTRRRLFASLASPTTVKYFEETGEFISIRCACSCQVLLKVLLARLR